MKVSGVKFNAKSNPEFFVELRKRVNAHFKENNISKHANANMVVKTIFMVSLYFIPLAFMIFGSVSSLSTMYLLWLLMSLGMSGIGLSVMHDANHGSYSNNKQINNALGLLITFIGGYHVNWKIQHNVLHHSFTNIHGHDEDIEKGVMRFSPTQERKPIFRFQLFYAPILYGLLTIYWLIAKDFEQLARYRKKGLLKAQGLTYGRALAHTILCKIVYTIVTIILPFMILPFAWWQILLGFLGMHFLSGLILALIFQPAHVLEETEFFVPGENGSVENSWAIHQMKTTANFANNSVLFSWLIGGLNFQIEHHLFPNICHVHYKQISKIVKSTADEFGVPYYQHRTFFDALKSHFTLLHELGTGEYDRKLQEA